MEAENILDKLDSHFDTYRRASPYDDFMRMSTFRSFEPYIKGRSFHIVEYGCSDGLMTSQIAKHAASLDVVEGSGRFIEEAKRKVPNTVRFHHSLFSEFRSDQQYDAIFATFVLTHIQSLESFFLAVKKLLKSEGLLFVAVPNARVLSRQLACKMGLIEDLFLLSENDRNHGHCRVYDRTRLNRDVESHGMMIQAQGGIILKPLADFQMDKLMDIGVLGEQQLKGLCSLGVEYPDLSAVIYSVCKKGT